jgi:tetratricopeptide (TPR) repeat protein/transcriptional regulator with XRE-family HTH domain
MTEGTEADLTLADLHRVRTPQELGGVLRQLRRRHARRHNAAELTVRELSRRSGYAYGAISDYLNGKALAPTDRFDVLIRLLGATAAEQRALATARDRVAERRRARRTHRVQGVHVGVVPRELPPDVYGFTGRATELAELDRLLDRAGGGPGVGLISAVAGTAGVGKTALAVRWAHRVGREFPDGCLYVDLRGYDADRPMRPAEALAGFLRSLGVDGTDLPHDEAERAARYRTLLADRRMLIVLDNASNTDQVRPLLPGSSSCVVVVTSRDALNGLVVRHGARRIRLDPLPPGEAVELLEVLIGDRVAHEPDAAAALADRCVRLPLTLRLAAELASARTDATLAELDAELADVRQRLDRLDAAGDGRTASRAVFSWSYANLEPAAARAFRLLGVYPGHDLDEHGLAALAGTDLDRARSLLDELARAHLVQPVRSDRYGMHDLLRAYAVERAADDPESERQAALDRLLDHHLHACSIAMDVIAPFDRDRRPKVPDPGWPARRPGDRASAIAWLDDERPNLIAAAVHAAGQGRATHAGQLAAIIIRYLDMCAHHHDAELLYRRVVDTAADHFKAHALTSLGVVCWRLGRYQEAVTHHETALRVAGEIDDKAEVGRALTGLGIVYWQLGRTADTLRCGQQALELYGELGDRIGQAWVLGNLGTVHRRLGDYPAALDHYQRSLALFREVGDPAGLCNELCGLGALHEELGHFDEALGYLQECLDLCRRTGYRETEAQALSSLGIVYLRLGRLAEALDHQRQALRLLREIGDRAAEGYALGYLGTVYERMGRYADAVDHHNQALTIAEEIGDDHLTAEVLNRLGDALLCDDRPAEALCSYRRALAITDDTGNRYQQARAHHGIARASAGMGNGDNGEGDAEAAVHRERALALYTELGVPEADEVRAASGRRG